MCESWATQGFGAPAVAYLFYVAKIAVYVAVWVVFVSRAPEVAGLGDIGDWWATAHRLREGDPLDDAVRGPRARAAAAAP